LFKKKRKTEKAKPSVGILVLKKNKVLLVKNTLASIHAEEIYGLPSGKVDKGETQRQAAKRELKEETGLICQQKNLVEFPGNYFVARVKYKDGKNDLWGWRVFLCKNYKGKLKNNEVTEPYWVEIDKLKTLILLPNIIKVVRFRLKSLQQ